MLFKITSFFSLIFFLFSCGNPAEDRQTDAQRIKDEMEARKVKHITPAQIMESTQNFGKSNAEALQKNLSQVLTEELSKGALLPAAEMCNVDWLRVSDSLQKNYRTQIKRLPLKGKSTKKLTNAETQIMEAYQYNLEQKMPLEDNIQKIGDSLLVFTSPVLISEELCLRCHGKVGKDIAESDFKKLIGKYPDLQQLSNFDKNQPIGIWSFIFQKDEIIKRTKVKK